MTQPTAADEVLSDAEVLDKFQRTIGDFWVKGPDVSTAHEIQRLRSLLESRLARAESAPGVTVPIDTAKAARDGLGIAADHHARSEEARDELNRHWEILSDAIDAALADAGTEAE